jgi:hypothetical protein
MKKILRLVTTSVLTLTLVACGEASSSVSSSVSSTPASSVSSVSSAYANVTTVTLSAATATLTQVLGAQRRVTVTAALNANTNPNLALEWFVNGVKSNQTGRVLEYVPTEVGAFVISAKVGNISSNNLTVNVSLPTLAVEEVEWASASQILVTAPGGAVVTVSGNEVLDTSIYDLTDGQYVVNLKTPFTQGQTATLSLAREGEAAFTQVVTYDTREFAISKLQYRGTEVKAVNGVYKIARPFDANTNSLTFTSVYQLDFTHKNVIGTSNVPLAVQSTVPTGATAIVDSNSLVTNFTNLQFNVTSATALGVYTHKVTLGPKVVEVKVEVVAPEKEISVVGDTILFDANGDGDLTDTGDVIKAGADGVFEITKPFETMFSLAASATTITVPNTDASTVTTAPTNSIPFRVTSDGTPPAFESWNGTAWTAITFTNSLSAPLGASTPNGFASDILVESTATSTIIDGLNDSGNYWVWNSTNRTLAQLLPGALQQRELKVTYRAINFTKPEFVENQQSVSLKGPSANLAGEVTLFSGMETETLIGTTLNNSATSLPLLVDFDATGNNLDTATGSVTTAVTFFADETSTQDIFTQKIDRGTPTGVYTFTITAGTSSNQLTKEVKVRVVEPKAALDLVVVGYASGSRTLESTKVGDVYTIEKPIGEDDFELSWYGVLSNYHSSLSTVNQVITDDLLTGTAKNTFKETAITPIVTNVGNLGSGFAKANTSYNLVAYEIDVTGPNATLIPEVATTKARVLLGRNKSSVVLFNQNDTQITTSTTYTALDLNGASFADTTATTGGLNRDGLVIDKDTVTGSYVVTLRLDNLVKTFTIVVSAPTAKIALGNNPIAAFKSDADILLVSNGILGTHDFSTGALTGSSGLVTGASNTFKVEKGAAAVSFKANVNLYDFPAGSYNYEVRREYPDGRVEVVSDAVTVTAAKFAAATVQRLPSDGTNLWELDLGDTKFDANWTINETSLTALGAYKYTFKFGTVTEVFTINVEEAPSMKLNNLALAGSNLVLFGGAYRVLPSAITATAMTVVADITQLNLPSNAYYRVLATSSATANLVVGGTDIGDSFTSPTATAADQALLTGAVTNYLKVGSLKSIDLGTINLGAAAIVAADKVTYAITFFIPNAANNGFTQIGDSTGLVFVISATAAVS